jgi:UDP:flavonoid glycosyltransferase YjiC (YdhE family)
MDMLGQRPTIHVTFGTVSAYNTAPAIYDCILSGLGCKDVNVVLTTGENNDPNLITAKGKFIYVDRYIPHPVLLPLCSVVFCHGGCGTTAAALSNGIPLLITPRGGSTQRRNALACKQVGVARILCDWELNPESVWENVQALLAIRSYKTAAEQLAREISKMPAPAEAVGALQHLVSKRPLPWQKS